jgi:hypothetical protein
MLVSAFEIRRHDRERQHYRLSVTNLEDRDFEYSVEFHGEQSSGSASSFSGTTTLAFTVDGGAAEDAVVFLRQPHVYGLRKSYVGLLSRPGGQPCWSCTRQVQIGSMREASWCCVCRPSPWCRAVCVQFPKAIIPCK